MVKKEKLLNVGGINADSKVLQGIIDFLSSGQIVITSVNTDAVRSVTLALADPLNVEITAPIDDSTGGVQSIDTPHHEIHEGDSYEYCDIQTLNNADTKEYLIETPAGTEEQHLTWSIKGSAITTIQIYKASTRVGDNDVTASVFNMNHRSGNTANITLDDSITGAGADGTLFFCDHGGSAQGNFRASNETASREERVLDAGSKYLFRITSGTNGNLTSLRLIFYQHTPEA